jgi:hypothetical protein
MAFLKKIIENSRLLEVLHDNLPVSMKTSQFYQSIREYLENYCEYNSLSAEHVVNVYTDYIVAYNKHCKEFIKTGKYPAALGNNTYFPNRIEYDIVLILSVLFTQHRYRIMQLLAKQHESDKALYIGLGPGLEMELTAPLHKEIYGYDLSLNPFLKKHFNSVSLHAELYTGQYPNYFNTIYLIELLEHLEHPFDLLDVCYASLQTNGLILLTTATDIPQFDHLYNFPDDHKLFDEKLMQMGFEIVTKEKLEHHYLTLDLRPSNHFYAIRKK